MAQSKNSSAEMPNGHLHELFIDELRDILGAERQLLKGLKKMASAAESETLKKAFETHYSQTEGQIERLKQVFTSIGLSARGKKCKAMEGLLEEADSIIEDTDSGTLVRDAGLILAAQKVEHYEIATYGTLRVFAENMGHTEVVELLSQTLEEEKATDVALTQIAEGFVNQQAASE